MRSVLKSEAIIAGADLNIQPELECMGKCDGVVPHEFSHFELTQTVAPNDRGVDLIYFCDTCFKRRRWGCLDWDYAVSLDPTLSSKLLR